MKVWKIKTKVFLSTVLTVPTLLFAKAVCATSAIVDAPTGGVLPVLEPEKVFEGLIFNSILILGGVATLVIIYGGYWILTHGDNNTEIEKGKKIITYAVVGIIVIALAATIVKFALEVIK